ncbi:helix-turn-helix domain-containing protein [Streptomyces sp. AK04-3B]|uniref:helix-turn-helix domain-containing protein n=1 Tax=Streptomyces sp. AK04-3B TaxID=3028650 RepID=UPI0029B90BB0|nr:helix-turn-helix domain-containing protein [Streptomyces sp. AK04-3B]MDX3799215.1 helix-turn-helix domain containing protein [Streptomyces sp. AK04-3B]
MVRLTRAQQQERTRAAVLTAAKAEFAERGYATAKVDGIAERAELTRGAVYSNFPSKRALYLAVLIDMVERAAAEHRSAGGIRPPAAPQAGGRPHARTSTAEALEAFARIWLERLPLAGQSASAGRAHLGSLTEVLDDEPIRAAFGQVTRLEALLLALALESLESPDARPCTGTPPARQVRRAQLVLRLLDGPGASADPALGFGDPFDIAQACAHLGGLALADAWNPPHLPYVPPARACRDRWEPPRELRDLLSGRLVGFAGDGVITVLGARRLEAAEEAVRSARAGDLITVAVTTADPAGIGRLVRLRIGDFARCLGRAFDPDDRPRLRVVLDERTLLASAVGVPDADDTTEYAVRVRHDTIVTRAQGPGAAHAAAAQGLTTADVSHTTPDGAAP